MSKLWKKKRRLNKEVEAFETKDDLFMDQKLVRYDCLGSLAQAKMLLKIRILSPGEFKKLKEGLMLIIKLNNEGKFNLKEGDEDVHTKIENFLTEKYGDTGRKIHTGRSRNDQVATAIRFYCKDKMGDIEDELVILRKAFLKYAYKYGKIKMPGYTHMQKAMPSSVGLWAGSFADSITDDLELLNGVLHIVDQSPLGSAAGYGVPIDLKRSYTAREMGFAKVQENSLYCQNSRGKFEAIILGSLISCLMTVNKFASDVMLFTTSEAGFFGVAKTLVTGSSIMPQKNNIDVAELLRSKVHTVLGKYMAVVSLSSNLPSGYNRDLQESKKPLFESLSITLESLRICKILLDGLKPMKKNLEKAMTPELYAAHEALKLSLKGIPFRKAYKKVAGRYR